MSHIQQQLRHQVDPDGKTSRDDIYQHHRPYKHFSFDQEVVSVFPDMISRSVPGYWLSNQCIGVMCRRFAKPNTNIYDLGCSLGASSYSILSQDARNGAQLIAIDGSIEMIKHLSTTLRQQYPEEELELLCADIRNHPLHNASVVIMHYTLQFIPPAERNKLLERIHRALVPGGVLLISEKVRFANLDQDERIRTWHHDFKAAEGYSNLEIEQKARDISHSMQTDTLDQLHARFRESGFSAVTLWMRCYGFSSFVVEK